METKAVIPIENHKGVITEINPGKYYGKLKDLETEKEYRFDIKAVKGNTPSKKAAVRFQLQDENVISVEKL